MTTIGIVLIGRNEASRLSAALDAARRAAAPIVYVDSGSTDDSLNIARRRRVETVRLDPARPFTAARARNAGLKRLLALHPELNFVQFVDADCILDPHWLPAALTFIRHDPNIAAVFGRRREERPHASVYNQLLDMEWNTPLGQTPTCGGDALFRVRALHAVGGFDPKLICGEEPDLCLRLRRARWHIYRLDLEMTRHDANLTRFSQWFIRCVRGGWAWAEGAARYAHLDEPFNRHEHRSIWAWSLLLPATVLLLLWPLGPATFVLLTLYPLMGFRVARYRRRRGDRWPAALRYSFFCVLGKFPEAVGQGRYWLSRLRRRPPRLIEYKSPPAADPPAP